EITTYLTKDLLAFVVENKEILAAKEKEKLCVLIIMLDIDPSGMILVSEGHDSSIHLWDIVSTRQCIQEFVSHRRKSDECQISSIFTMDGK
ncbi:11565_t:CDS:2, partial [Gigaspora rosea]